MRWVLFLLLACQFVVIGTLVFGQELSPSEAKRVPVPQPTNVTVVRKKRRLLISWDVTPIQRVTAYEVFQKASDNEPVQVAKVEKPPVVTTVPVTPTDYFVVAVDYRNNRSKPSPSVTYPPPKKKN